jgi:hypothetical protein
VCEPVTDTLLCRIERTVVLLLMLYVALVAIPPSYASQQLVKNGGFESGNFTGWTIQNAKVRPSSTSGTYYEPAHNSSRYSARLGTESTEGSISQTVTIPAKSDGKFTAWYRVEKGATLTIYLKRNDGSVIQQWSVSTGVSTWTVVSYDLDLSYAGQTVNIEFVGIGHRETVSTSVITYCYDQAGRPYPCTIPYVEYNDYWPYVDDVSLTSTVVAFQATITVTGFPQGMVTNVFADGAHVAALAAGQSQTLLLRIGSPHTVSVDTYLQEDNLTRFYCASDSASVSSDGEIMFTYKPQYYLSVSSPFGESSGNGWYDGDSKASFSVDPSSSPLAGLLGILGGKNVFEKWTGDATGTSTHDEIVMKSPKSVSAVWRADYSSVYLIIALIGLALGVGGLVAYRRFKGKPRPDKTQVYDVIPVSVEDTMSTERIRRESVYEGDKAEEEIPEREGQISEEDGTTRHQKHRNSD